MYKCFLVCTFRINNVHLIKIGMNMFQYDTFQICNKKSADFCPCVV